MHWESFCQHKRMQINRDTVRENKRRANYDYKVGDKFMLTKHTTYKN